MKTTCLFLLAFILVLPVAAPAQKTGFGAPNVDVQKIESDFISWWTYHYNTIALSSDFVALDPSSKVIDKATFLKELTTGNFIAVQLKSGNGKTIYKLFRLGPNAPKDIGSTMKSQAEMAYRHFLMEGQKFPAFSFTDLNGNVYTNANTKGKIIVLKCWFIACTACIKEFPQLNALVQKYKNRKDVLFISLASDPKASLKNFIAEKHFDYAVIPEQGRLMYDVLKFNMYPTHLIIDRNGIIRKVVNRADELIAELESGKYLMPTGTTPPPMVPVGKTKAANTKR